MKLRYAVVGGSNTALDFGILFILHVLGLPILAANIISTTTAFCFSFIANKKFTFKTTGSNVKKELILFVTFTLIGLWGLQSIIIWAIHPFIASFHLGNNIEVLVLKLIASVATLVWNYLLYSRVVFKKHTEQQ
jgi:putative flippase GtrA